MRRGFRGEKFVATFKFKWNGSSSTSPGFLVRWLNPGDWVAVYVKSSDGKARLDRRKDDGVVTNLATAANALSLTSGTWYGAKVVVDDDLGNSALQRLRLYVDANANGFGDDAASLDTTAVDDDFSAGYCGLFRSNLYADTQQFDDFKLGIDNSSPRDGDFDDAGDEIVIDDNFNSTTTNLAYDDNGNLTDDGVFKYVYDAWNRLVKVTWRIKSSPSNVAVYSYDGANRRVSKVVSNSGVEYVANDGGNTTINFFYGDSLGGASATRFGMTTPWSIYEERNGSNQSVRQYAWGTQYVDEILWIDLNAEPAVSNDSDPDTTGGGESAYADKRFFCSQDRNWNVVALTEYVPSGASGASGRVVERCLVIASSGSTFALDGDNGTGELTRVQQCSGSGNAMCYQGLAENSESATRANRRRVISTLTGRFMQPDPFHANAEQPIDLLLGDGANYYGLARNNPMLWVDPAGLWSQLMVVGCNGKELCIKPEDPPGAAWICSTVNGVTETHTDLDFVYIGGQLWKVPNKCILTVTCLPRTYP
ncbi:MAG: RHS repeat-associated core domain-containing protein [Phycisphaerae bacterium]